MHGVYGVKTTMTKPEICLFLYAGHCGLLEINVGNNTERGGGGESVLSNSFQYIFLIYTLNNSSNIDHYFVCQNHKIMSRNKKSK